MKKTMVIKSLTMALLLIALIGLLYVFIGPRFEISITQSWGRVTHDTTEINTVIAVSNPTPLSRWLKKVVFDLYINDLKIASEVSERSIEVRPLGKTETSFTSFLNNSKIPDLWATYLNNGDLFDVQLMGNVTFGLATREAVLPIGYRTSAHTPLLELLNIGQPKDVRVGPATLTLKSLNLTWGEVTLVQTEIDNNALIYNPNSYPITIKKINYAIEMNSVTMGEGATENPITLETKKDNEVSFTSVLNNTMLDEWWAAHIRNDQVTRIVVKLQGIAEVSDAEYNCTLAETWAEASIRILSGTISYGYFLPLL